MADSADQGELDGASSASEDDDIPEERSTPFDCLYCAFPDVESVQTSLATFSDVNDLVGPKMNVDKASKIPEEMFDLVGGKEFPEPKFGESSLPATEYLY